MVGLKNKVVWIPGKELTRFIVKRPSKGNIKIVVPSKGAALRLVCKVLNIPYSKVVGSIKILTTFLSQYVHIVSLTHFFRDNNDKTLMYML